MGYHTKTVAVFINEARLVHGDRYDYSCVEYKNNRINVKIICRTHGAFFQTPQSHLHGHGCVKCGMDSISDTTETFIRKAKLKFGNTYDYSMVDYKRRRTPVKIKCPLHGVFEERPIDHLNRRGKYSCPLCREKHGKVKDIYHKKKTQKIAPYIDPKRVPNQKYKDVFIKRAKSVHGDLYDYSQVVYYNAKILVAIICKEHGVFWQAPDSHTKGRGCALCNRKHRYSRREWVDYARNRICKLYVVSVFDNEEEFIKIGITAKVKIKDRFRFIKREGYGVDVLHVIEGDCESIYDQELAAQRLFKNQKYMPRKLFGGYTECYKKESLLDILQYFLQTKRVA
jgi:hypothetical protein